MKISSPQAPKPPQHKAVLLMGPPGSFKTTLMLQFPKLHVIDCDGNLDGPEHWLRKIASMPIEYSYEGVAVRDDGTICPPQDCYERIVRLVDAAKTLSCEWVGVDGLTAINEYIIRKIMAEQRVSYMEARNWSSFKTDAINLIFGKLRHVGKNVIVTAHEVRITKADQKNIMNEVLIGYEPFIQSKVSEMLGGYFTDVWRLSAETAPAGKMEWTLQTTKIPLYSQLKNSCAMPSEIKKPTWAELSKYLS